MFNSRGMVNKLFNSVMEYSQPFKVMFLNNILMVRKMLMRIKVGCKPVCFR